MFLTVYDPTVNKKITIPFKSQWFEKIETGIYVDGRHNSVVEVGRFGFYAPRKEMRNARLYVATITQNLPVDPPTSPGATRLCYYAFIGAFCMANSQYANRTWSNCIDQAYGQGEGTCTYLSGTVANFNFNSCSTTDPVYAPYFFVFSSQPQSNIISIPPSGLTMAFSRPCPFADVANLNTAGNVLRMTDNVKVRGVDCLDTNVSPPQRRVSYSTMDNVGNQYSVSWVGIGQGRNPDSATLYTLLQVSPFTKGSNDVYYYVYRIGFPLGGSGAPWTQ